MAKIRIYELARELDTDSKTLEQVVRDLGIEIKSYMSTLTPDEAERVKARFGGGAAAAAPAAKPVARSSSSSSSSSAASPVRRKAKVIRRRASGPRPAEKEKFADHDGEETSESPVTPTVRRTPDGSSEPVRRTTPPLRRPAANGDSASRPAEGQRSAVSNGGSSSAVGAGDSNAVAPKTEDAPARRPQVGERIQLPANTRRFASGLANRMDPSGQTSGAQVEPPPRPETPSGQYRPGQERTVERKIAPRVEARPEPKPEPKPEPRVEASAVDEDEDRDGENKLLRDENGVIIGVKKEKQGPTIVDFIQIEPRRKQQVIITEASPQRTKGRASQRKKREEKIQQQQRRRNLNQRNRRRDRSGPKGSSTVEMREEKKRIRVDEVIQVSDLAHQMSVKAPLVIKALWKMGMRGTVINSSIDVETAELVAAEFGYTVENVSFDEEELIVEEAEDAGELRAPVVTIMGHVDHGKTTLLDYIRSSRVAAGEAGGITQHTSAYRVETKAGPVVFVDTPGHEAFSAMRSRGAELTDIVVLIVAADDGVMPTTVEAIKHAREADVPIVVAVNKVDKPEANVGRVKQMLMEHSLIGEEFGGETTIAEISAKTGQGVENLLELLGLQAEVLDLRSPADGRAQGLVIESRVDKGRGTVATLLVQRGTLEKGAVIVSGESYGKIRGIRSTTGEVLKNAGPSVPVDVQGFDVAPSAGERFYEVESDKDAKQVVAHRREQRRRKESVKAGPSAIFDRFKAKKTPTLKLILRADVQGSAEALKETLEDLSTPKVTVEVISAGVGAISENDVKLAHAGGATIIGFNVKPVGKAAQAAEAEGVDIRTYEIIYKASDEVVEMMIDQLEPEQVERPMGEAEVRELFPIPRLGTVCGSRVMKGSITRSSNIRVKRNGKLVHEGKIASLRVFKDDVREVKEGFECGIVVDGLDSVEPGDVLEAYEIDLVRPSL